MIQIANINIEFECASPFLEPFEFGLSRHPLCLQLQFLPLLYAQAGDIVAVTAIPDHDYLSHLEKQIGTMSGGLPTLALLSDHALFQEKECLSWGPSRQVQIWAESRQVKYDIPNWSIAQLVNSKAFSFRYTCLPQAELLFSEESLFEWLRRVSGSKVLKTCFGLAGRGNWRIDDNLPSSKLLTFCRREWEQNRPIIAEPWLHRICDFSSQWFIHSDHSIEFIGGTRFESDEKGVYQGTLAGPQELLFASYEPFLQEHCEYVQRALVEIAHLGFFGHLGIDAFLYHDPSTQNICLNPLVEINGRQTMSWVALRLQQKVCSKKILRLAFESPKHSQMSLLPSELMNAKGERVKFKRDLTIKVYL